MTEPFNVRKALDRYYPGSRKLRGVSAKRTAEAGEFPNWYERPVLKKLGGREIEMFTVGALARALGKSVPSVRLWEANGYIPATPYRNPTRVVNGQPRKGRRLYTQAQIEAAVAVFDSRGVLDSPRIEWRDHPDLPQALAEKWRLLQERLATTPPIA